MKSADLASCAVMCPICRPAIAGKTAPSCLLRVGIEICQVLLSAKKSSAIASSRAWQAGPTVVKLHGGELGFAEALFRGWSLEATCSLFLILPVLCQTTLKKDQCTSSRTRNLIGIVHMNGFRLVFGISHSRFFLSHSMQLLFHLLFTFRYFSTDILRSSPTIACCEFSLLPSSEIYFMLTPHQAPCCSLVPRRYHAIPYRTCYF